MITAIPIRKSFSGNSDGRMLRKRQGFEQLGNYTTINKSTEHKFRQLTDGQKMENQKDWKVLVGYGRH